MARARNTKKAVTGAGEFVCPECGRTFTRAAALGAHRSRVHGVAGVSAKTRSRARRAGGATTNTASAGNRAGSLTPATRKPRRASATGQASGGRRGRRSSSAGASSVNRDGLLEALFPGGIPARENILREVSTWLDEAERIAKLA